MFAGEKRKGYALLNKEMTTINLGKIRGLTQLSTSKGIFAILACDQRRAIIKMMTEVGKRIGYSSIVQMKQEIVAPLSKIASGVLLDPEYGVGPNILSLSLSGQCGLVLALDETGYIEEDKERITRILSGWNVEKIKRLGASAVKLLVYYNPNHKTAANKQEHLVAEVAEQCRDLDIPFMLETLVYPTSQNKDLKSFSKEKESLVVESARILSQYDIDLYKVEFPVDIRFNQNLNDWGQACSKLSRACRTPWALLSAGVDFDTYLKQVQIACEAGASGFVGGRAIWKEAITLQDGNERKDFITRIMPERMSSLLEVAERTGRPWFEVSSYATLLSSKIEDNWYQSY